LGVAALAASGAVETLAEARDRWLVWGFGDVVGAIVVAPALLTWLARPRTRLRWSGPKAFEAVLVLGLLVSVTAALYSRGFPYPYPVFPFLAWAAVRLGSRGAALGALIVWALTVWFAALGVRVSATMGGDIINLLAFTALAGATALLLAAAVAEREAVAEEEERTLNLLQGVVSGSGDAIFVKDLDGRYLMVNEAAARVFGTTPRESVGLTDLDLFPESEYCRIIAADRAVLATGKARTLEERVTARAGETLDFLTTKAPYRDAAGRMIGVIGVARDITEMKRTEERLRESEEKYRFVVESAADYITLLDRDGRFVFINRVAKGFDRDRVIGASMYDYVPPEDRPAVRKTIEDVVRTGQPATYEVQGLGDEGAPAWYRCTVGPVLKDGEVVSVTVIANDITDRVRMEGRLRKSEAQFRSVVASVPDFVHTLDRDGRIVFANRGAEGLDVSDLVGGFAWDHVVPEDRARMREAVAAVFRSGKPETREVRGLVGGESRRWYLCRVCPVVEGGRVDRAVLVAQDITESRVREEELRTSRERLRRLSRRLIEAQETERGHIARELHDEIGQALTAVKMSLQAAVRKGPGASLDDSIALVDGALGQVRDLSVALRPSLLDELGLVPALRWYLSQQAQRVGFSPRFEADSEIGAAPDIETACFRIAQEALTNVARHA
ncbi:MAG: PAS domain-containing protein, partial [Thermoanaerobaculia bacterium]